MRKSIVVLISSVVISILISIFLILTKQNPFTKKPSGLEITTNIPVEVYINGKKQDLTTNYKNQNLKAGQYTIKLQPQDTNISPWETKLTLIPGISAVINRNFNENISETYGYIIQFQKIADKNKALISIVSDPDNINVAIDGTPQGFAPITQLPLQGNTDKHSISLSSPGFKQLDINIRAIKGYSMLINAQLASDIVILQDDKNNNEASSSATNNTTDANSTAKPTADKAKDDTSNTKTDASTKNSTTTDKDIKRPYVIIKETGTGWLRVRNKPNTTTSEELGKVNVGEKLKFIESNETGWYKVIFEGQEAWISGKYADIYR